MVVRKGERTRETILDRAVVLASELGLEGLSLGRLAEDLDLSKSGLFAHFDSKEALQIQTLDRAAERFSEVVVRPALAAPRGEPRIRTFFERWLHWQELAPQAGCIFVAAAAELDDRPGPVRERLVELQREKLQFLARAAELAQGAGHFRADLDVAQFAFELHGIMLAYHEASRLLSDAKATRRAREAFERLLASARR